MRRAILGYHASGNLGDAVQSYAMLELLGADHPVSLVDRDDFGSFNPTEETRLFLNGWFIHRPDRFFLSPRVVPTMVGVHLSPSRPMHSRYPPFADIVRECPSVRRIFQQATPVGARDLYTLGVLQGAGIDSYFAGCPTMTLRPKGLESNGSIVAVDVPTEVCDALERRMRKPITRTSNDNDSSWTSTSALRGDVEPYLDLLERAELVITTRLHVALPARALGIHTVFAPRDVTDPRFSGLADFLPVVVPLTYLSDSPLSLFAESPWTAAKDITEQARTITQAVSAASDGLPSRADESGTEPDRLLLELERAAIVYDRVQLTQNLRRLKETRLWRHSSWLRRHLR
jgi:hypothetical protein